ncbi:MAG: PD-(D/E)XK nuclease family protein [Candidatus Omnitrophica bacterium]|nr:PD-(D/E)XK nuclease family protein [Candidatus Omnitrophota bacterium]
MNNIITYSFCESFKDRLVGYIREQYIEKGRDLSRLAVVFGGRRPALFLKRDLANVLKKGFYPPRFFTIDEFMKYTVEKNELFTQTKDLDNCFLLYQLAKKVAPQILEGRETFAQFLPWTREISKFIDQLDLEKIEEPSLKNIQANAEIGYDVPEDINRLLQSVIALRRAYHEELLKRRTYSRGLQYLKASQRIAENAFEEFDQILFCNFFYFHRTEETVVKDLYRRGQAALIFQGDERKWPVLERIAKMFDMPIREGEQPRDPKFSLHLYAGFDIHSQVGLVREIFKKMKKPEKSVIVLPEPDHVIPLLSEIHSLIKDYNVSMGYPLKRSSLYSLFEFVFKAQLSSKDGRYYTKDYLKALRHPFIKNLKLTCEAAVTRILIHKIEEVLMGKEKTSISGSLYIRLNDMMELDDIYLLTLEMLKRLGMDAKRKDLQSILGEIHDLLFIRWEQLEHFQDFSAALEHFLGVLADKSFLQNYPLNLNIAARVYDIKDELEKASFAQERFSKEEMFRVFDHKLASEIIAFSGSPLKGLQILGLLETRSLNFDHVIILDVNEGVLPSLQIHEPLIPREVMISLGLDRLELEEEIQRYQFMRLISSAKEVHLVYQEGRDKERSRFVEELIWEEQKKNKEIAAHLVARPSFLVDVRPKKKSVRKTPEVIKFLKGHTYSASSVNMYLRDPMEFYTNYVLGLREQDDLLDEPEARHVGTFMHELLEESYEPFLHKEPKIDKLFRDRCLKLFEQRFEATFAKTMRSDSFLLRSIMIERLNQFLDNEQFNEERKVKKILYLENRFDDTVMLPAGNIKFRYVVDRVDELQDGTVLIVDYKTGGTDSLPKPVVHIENLKLSREAICENIRSFQVPLYFYYFSKQYPKAPVNAALYNLKTIELHKFIGPKTPFDIDKINEVFLNALNFVIAEILDPDRPFEEATIL